MNDFVTSAFKPRLKSGQKLVGIRMQVPNTIIAEALGLSGFDYVYIDMEHSPFGLISTLEVCQAIVGTPAIPVVRLPSDDLVLIQQLLDAGIENLVIPMVENAHQAQRIASVTRYPPKGTRSVARLHRGNCYGRKADQYNHVIEEKICLTLQIETRTALKNLPEIAAVDGVDAVLFGPGDLAADFGHIGKTEHPEVLEAISTGVAAGLETGKLVGMSTADASFAKKWFDQGCSFVSVGSDLQLLMRSLTQAATTAGALALKPEWT
jgi:4-hydroxy-2-oxoheptanedioate aldolase